MDGFPIGYRAVLGITTLRESGVSRTIDRVIRYPTYADYSKYYLNDIALLHLARPVLYQNNILPICLPSATDLPTRTDCVVTGWGAESREGKVSSKIVHCFCELFLYIFY